VPSSGSTRTRRIASPTLNFRHKSPSRQVSIWTGLRHGWSGVRIPVETRDFSLLQYVQTGCGTHPASYSVGTVVLSQGSSSRGVNLNTHLHLVSRLRVDGAIPPLPLYHHVPWTVTTVLFFFFLILKAIKSPQNTKYLANCRARLVTGSVSWRGNCGHLVEQVLLNNRKLIIHPNTNKAFSVFRKKGKWSGTNRIAVPPPPPWSLYTHCATSWGSSPLIVIFCDLISCTKIYSHSAVALQSWRPQRNSKQIRWFITNRYSKQIVS